MPARFFGQFLIERGVVTSDMLLDAVTYQKSINNPLCALAVEKGYLNKEQLRELDGENRKSDEKFLKLAIEKKMLTFEQLEEIGKIKSEKWVFLGEALVQRGHIRLAQLQDLFEEYKKERMAGDEAFGVSLDAIREKVVVEALMKITVDIFLHYSRQIVKVISVEEEAKLDAEEIAYVFSQKVVGDKNFVYVLALPEALMLPIASYILQEEVTKVDEMALDAVSEFVNVVVGNGCAKMSMNNWRVRAEPPKIMTKEMLAKTASPVLVTVRMRTTKGDFKILFSFVGEKA